jgi:hypothetical protein
VLSCSFCIIISVLVSSSTFSIFVFRFRCGIGEQYLGMYTVLFPFWSPAKHKGVRFCDGDVHCFPAMASLCIGLAPAPGFLWASFH